MSERARVAVAAERLRRMREVRSIRSLPDGAVSGATAGVSGRKTARVKVGQPRQFRDLGLMICERVTGPPDVNFEKDFGVVWPTVPDGVKDQPMLHGGDFEAPREEGIQFPEPLD